MTLKPRAFAGLARASRCRCMGERFAAEQRDPFDFVSDRRIQFELTRRRESSIRRRRTE